MTNSLPQNLITSILRPKVTTITDFTNDVINFNIDDRFRPVSLVKQLEVLQGSNRDGTGKLNVDFGIPGASTLSISMFSPVYEKLKIQKFIKTDFTEFVPAE